MASLRFMSLNNISLFAATWFCFQNLRIPFEVSDESMPMGYEPPRHTSSGSSSRTDRVRNVPVFYNLYVTNESDADRVQQLVNEQFSFLRPEHYPVYVNSIGHQIHVPNTTLLKHSKKASEAVTLQAIWKYCQYHQEESVVYMHSKG
jgi:hypothetical protein